jgi:hypothetical protein
MKDKEEKPSSEMTDDEKIESKKEMAKSAVVRNIVIGDRAQIILLMDSVDKLKVSVEKGTESSNKLTKKVKSLTSALVVIGIIALIIGLGSVILQLIILF